MEEASRSVISVNTLARNFEKTVDLVKEMLLEPRWDEEEFGLIKDRVINGFTRNKANPGYMASITSRQADVRRR